MVNDGYCGAFLLRRLLVSVLVFANVIESEGEDLEDDLNQYLRPIRIRVLLVRL